MATTAVLVLGLSMLLRIREEAPENLREALPPPPAIRTESAPAALPDTPAEADAQPTPAAKAIDTAGLPGPAGGATQPAGARSAPGPAPAPASLTPAAASSEDAAAQVVPEPRPFQAPVGSAPQRETLRPAPSAPVAASPGPKQADRLERAVPAADMAREAAPVFSQSRGQPKAASPAAESPEQRVETIRQLLRQGRSEEAKMALEELRRRYPAFDLPEDLRAIRRENSSGH
jgi:Meckel syndrome type 1 protein